MVRPATPDLVVVGAASRDVTNDDPRGWRLGGAVSYCSLTAARLGLRVGCVVGVDTPASTAPELDLLRSAGVDVVSVALAHGPVFENIERDGHRVQRWLSKSDPVSPGDLPADRVDWLKAAAFLIVPVAGEIGDDWAGTTPLQARVGLGWQGMLREFSDDGLVRRVPATDSPLLRRAGLAAASFDDLDPRQQLGDLRDLAPEASIVLTAGENGGVVLTGAGTARYPAIASTGVVDPTGAGDVFLASLMVAWIATGELSTARALRFAAAAASCSVEGVGLTGVPDASQVARRLASSGAVPAA